jgi:hypothetical protein
MASMMSNWTPQAVRGEYPSLRVRGCGALSLRTSVPGRVVVESIRVASVP